MIAFWLKVMAKSYPSLVMVPWVHKNLVFEYLNCPQNWLNTIWTIPRAQTQHPNFSLDLLFVLQIVFKYGKLEIGKWFFAGWDIKNVEPKARFFYVKPCKKYVFWSKPFYMRTKFWEHITFFCQSCTFLKARGLENPSLLHV